MALTSTPFLDMGLSMAVDHTHRIAGMHQENHFKLGDSVVGGGSYFSQSVSRGPSLSHTLPRTSGARHTQAISAMKSADEQMQRQAQEEEQVLYEMQLKEERQMQVSKRVQDVSVILKRLACYSSRLLEDDWTLSDSL